MRLPLVPFSALTTLTTVICAIPLAATAQIVPDNTLGSENSVVVPNQNIRGINSDRIDGGAVRGSNLFHSFEEFNIDEGRGAYFSNPDNIINILTRVTGGNISQILGTLGVLGNANFFLINPNGIVFGPNARLDVGGSFFATTADGILFDGFEFAASNPEAPPLLTINMPIGLNLRENPGTIVNQATITTLEDGSSLRNDAGFLVPQGLNVPQNQTLALVGGDVLFNNGFVISPGSRIQLGGLSEPGTVQINPDNSLTFPENILRGNVRLTNQSQINVRADGGGDVNINARNVEISGDSVIRVGIDDGLGFLEAKTGDININAQDSVLINEGTITNELSFSSDGNAGNILIQTPSLLIHNSGNISVNASDSGIGGNVVIYSNHLVIQDGANLSASGNGMNIIIQANQLELVGASPFGEISGIFLERANSNDNSLSLAQNQIIINTNNLIVRDGAVISARNSENSHINIESNTIELIGTTANLELSNPVSEEGLITPLQIIPRQSPSPSGLFSNSPGNRGKSNDITIETEHLIVRDGAQIVSSISREGDGGRINITAQKVELTGTSDNGDLVSGLFTVVGISSNLGNGGRNTFSIIGIPSDDELTPDPSLPLTPVPQGGDITVNTEQLVLRDGAQISTIVSSFVSSFDEGDAGNLNINANDIELTGISENGESPSGLFASAERGSEGDGGNISIETRRLIVQNGAQVGLETVSTGNAGELNIKADEIQLIGASDIREVSEGEFARTPSTIFATVEVDNDEPSTGDGGRITIDTRSLEVRDGAEISVSTFSDGDAGSINITANEIELIGTSPDSQLTSNIAASVERDATGKGGQITIDTERLTLRDGSKISASTFSSGNAGNIDIRANQIELTGTSSSNLFSSTIETSVGEGGTGEGGQLTMDAERIVLRDGGQIAVSTFGTGTGGNLSVNATEIELSGTSRDGQIVSGFLGSAQRNSSGESGSIAVNTERLLLRDGAAISVSTFGTGKGGELNITADEIELIGTSANGQSSSSISAAVRPEAEGQGGQLTVNTNRLTIEDGGQISTFTDGLGDAGDLTITASQIELTGLSSRIEASASPLSEGDGGTINLTAEELTLQDRSQITVSSQGEGAAGNLQITSPFIRLNNSARFEAETTAGEQGNITLNTEDFRLRNNSNITTNATGEATGGNIEINTDNLIAIEDSDISANADAAFGGQVIINVDAIFGTQFRQQQTGASDITATSELGADFSGTVELNSEIDPAQGLVDLPQSVVDPAELIAQDPCIQGRDSSFIITGRGGIAPDPTQPLSITQGLIEWESFITEPVTPKPNNSSQTRQQQSRNRENNLDDYPVDSRTIVPARGWIRTEDGEVILVSYDPTKTGVQRQPKNPHTCQPSK